MFRPKPLILTVIFTLVAALAGVFIASAAPAAPPGAAPDEVPAHSPAPVDTPAPVDPRPETPSGPETTGEATPLLDEAALNDLGIERLNPALPVPDEYAKYDPSVSAADARGLAADQIKAQADQNYAGLEVDEEANTVTVWWVGSPPSGVMDVVKGASDTTVRVLTDARFSRATMIAAIKRLMASPEWVSRLGVTAASPMVDGSGIKVFIEGDLPGSDGRTDVVADLEKFLGLPQGVTLIPNTDPVLLQMGGGR